jgi:hypothetical protein
MGRDTLRANSKSSQYDTHAVAVFASLRILPGSERAFVLMCSRRSWDGAVPANGQGPGRSAGSIPFASERVSACCSTTGVRCGRCARTREWTAGGMKVEKLCDGASKLLPFRNFKSSCTFVAMVRNSLRRLQDHLECDRTNSPSCQRMLVRHVPRYKPLSP